MKKINKQSLVDFNAAGIESKIYFIRGHRVMLDRDLAILYGVKPFRLREQVKRNKNRFPADFMIKLDRDETTALVSQNAIPSKSHLGGHLPYAFTEHGALMLSSVLKTDRAVDIGIFIVRVFVKMRGVLATQKKLMEKIKSLENKYDHKFKCVFDALRSLLEVPVRENRIGFLRDREE